MFNRKQTLDVEELGVRVMPSARITMPAPTLAPTLAPAITRQNHAAVEGLGTGTFTQAITPAGSAAAYQLSGRANTADLGSAAVTGSVSAVGSAASGRAQGTLTFTNARGSVTIALTGLNEQPANSALPKYFRYTVVSTSGYYQQFQGQHGTARIDLQTTPAGNTFRIAI